MSVISSMAPIVRRAFANNYVHGVQE